MDDYASSLKEHELCRTRAMPSRQVAKVIIDKTLGLHITLSNRTIITQEQKEKSKKSTFFLAHIKKSSTFALAIENRFQLASGEVGEWLKPAVC